MDWIIGSGSLRLCFLVHCGSQLDVEDWVMRRELAGGNEYVDLGKVKWIGYVYA